MEGEEESLGKVKPVFSERMGTRERIRERGRVAPLPSRPLLSRPSLNDPVQIVGLEEAPTQVHVRWPGGQATVSPVASGLREITVRFDGDER